MSGSVVGCVVSRTDGAPVPEASVEVLQGPDLALSALTDATGSFSFTDVPPGDWVFAAWTGRRRGYSPKVVVFDDAATAVTIEVSEAQDASNARRPRRKRGVPAVVTIQGWVRRSANDLPVRNATVILAEGPAPAPDIAAVTDDQGAFSFSGLAPGRWTVRALAPEGERGEAVADASGGDAEVSIDLTSA